LVYRNVLLRLGKETVSDQRGFNDGLTAKGLWRVLHGQVAEISLETERTVPLELGRTGRISPGIKCNTQESADLGSFF